MDVLHVLGCHPYPFLALAQNGPYGTYLIFGPKGGAEQSHRVQKLNPLALVPVGAAPGNIFHLPGVDHARLQPALVQDFIQRNPV